METWSVLSPPPLPPSDPFPHIRLGDKQAEAVQKSVSAVWSVTEWWRVWAGCLPLWRNATSWVPSQMSCQGVNIC